MADAFKRLYQGQLAAAAAALYTAPAATAAIVKAIRVVNTDTVSHSFTLYQGGTAAANQITGSFAIGPGETFIDTGPLFLAAGDTIAGKADTASVMTCTLGGIEVS